MRGIRRLNIQLKGELIMESNFMQKWLAICGMVGVIWFSLMWIILGAMWPGYNHVTQYVSELGSAGSPVSLLWNLLGFFTFGVLMVIFSYGLYLGTGARLGSFLMTLSGVGWFIVAIFPTEPGTMSFNEQMHLIGFLIISFSANLSMFTLSRSFRLDERWRSLWGYSLVTGIIALIILILLMSGALIAIIGLVQRIWGFTVSQWIFITAFKVFRLSES